MVIPTKFTPPSEPEGPTKAKGEGEGITPKESTAAKTTAPMTDDGSKKPFKEVLESTMGTGKEVKDPKIAFVPENQTEVERVSLLDLASTAGTKSKETLKAQPSVVDTAIFHKDAPAQSTAPTVSAQISDHAVRKADSFIRPAQTRTDVVVAKEKPVVKTEKTAVKAETGIERDTGVKKPVEESDIAIDKEPVVVEHVQTPAATKKVVEKEEVKTDDKVVVAPVVVPHHKETHTPDAAAQVVIAPHVVHAQAVHATVEAAPKVSNAREVLLKLAQQMVEQIQLVKEPGKTDTTFTLKHPPMFEGVQVKITEFETSKNQFNVTFTDVNNPTARALIETQDNQARLQQNLIDRGYTLQMVTIEQKIPGLSSTGSGDAGLGDPRHLEEGQAGSATDQEEGNVT